MTDTPEETRGNPHEFHPTAFRHNCPSCDKHWAWDDGYTAGLEAGRVDEAEKERARIVKQLRDEAEMPSEEGPALWLASFNGYDGTNSKADARVLLNAAADLVERGSGVPEGDTA